MSKIAYSEHNRLCKSLNKVVHLQKSSYFYVVFFFGDNVKHLHKVLLELGSVSKLFLCVGIEI